MTQLTVTDLENAKLDVETIAAIANSTANTVTDRLGAIRRTIYSLQNEYPNAVSASEILTTTMRKITVNTDNDIPSFASLLSDYIIKVKSSERNGGFSTTYYFDFDNQSLSWVPKENLLSYEDLFKFIKIGIVLVS